MRIPLLCLLFLIPAIEVQALEISFKANAEARAEQLLLGEAAEISGSAAETDWLRSQPIGWSPPAGQNRILRQAEVRHKLLRQNPGLTTATWSGSKEITVSRAGRRITAEEIKQRLDHYLAARRHSLPPGKLSLQNLQLPQPFSIPVGPLKVKIIPGNPNLLHNHSFSMIYEVDGETVKNLTARANLQIIGQLLCASRDLERGRLLTRDDLTAVEQDLGNQHNALFDPSQVIGKRLRRSLHRGDILKANQVEIPPLIKRGEQVLIVAQRGVLQLTAQGTARRTGILGDTIPVKNSATQKEILAVIAGSGLVKVGF